jgi:hypothetical protein
VHPISYPGSLFRTVKTQALGFELASIESPWHIGPRLGDAMFPRSAPTDAGPTAADGARGAAHLAPGTARRRAIWRECNTTVKSAPRNCQASLLFEHPDQPECNTIVILLHSPKSFVSDGGQL